jgi:hypothetical protein
MECESVTVDDLDGVGITIDPDKADTPLIVNPNAHLSRSSSFQPF